VEGKGEVLDPVMRHAAPRRLPHDHGEGVHVHATERFEQLHVHAAQKC